MTLKVDLERTNCDAISKCVLLCALTLAKIYRLLYMISAFFYPHFTLCYEILLSLQSTFIYKLPYTFPAYGLHTKQNLLHCHNR